MNAIPRFDEIYVISDLHMGGQGDFQMFGAGRRLSRFIGTLTRKPADRSVALIINGDMVDFLAEEPARYFDHEEAVRKLDRIMGDPSFKPVFQALTKFAKTPARSLVINMGNHDLELALPWVREHFLDALSGGDPAARGRIRLVVDGTGVRCQVAGAQVLCLHGNEVDPANYADYHRLRKIGFQLQAGNKTDEWAPNAGTKLVIDVMNQIKQKHPFVDLLKPIGDAVIPVLVALDVGMADKIDDVLRLASRVGKDKVRKRFGFLSDDDLDDAGDAPPEGEKLMGILEGSFEGWSDATDDRLDDMLRDIEQDLDRDPLDSLADPGDAELLGAGTIVAMQFKKFANWIRGKTEPEDKAKILLQALQPLKKDRSFEVDEADDVFKQLDAMVGGGIDFLVTGHTHMHRALRRRNNQGGYYYNSGTWVHLMRFTAAMLKSEKAFKPVFKALRSDSLDEVKELDGLLLDRTSVVVIQEEGGRAFGTLCEVKKSGNTVKLEVVPDTEFSR